jgi:hypothetical protein
MRGLIQRNYPDIRCQKVNPRVERVSRKTNPSSYPPYIGGYAAKKLHIYGLPHWIDLLRKPSQCVVQPRDQPLQISLFREIGNKVLGQVLLGFV